MCSSASAKPAKPREKRLAELRWHAFPVFGKKRLADVTAGDVLECQARMKSLVKPDGTHLASQTIKNVRSAISTVFEYAKSCNLVAANPVRLLGREQTRLPKDKSAMTVWTEQEVECFLRHVAQVDYQAYVVYQTLTQTGMRPSEVRGLCRDQIDFDLRVIHVRRQYGQREKGLVNRCKHGSERSFEMPEVLAKILRRYCEGFAPEDRLFPFVNGKFLWSTRQELMKAAGVRVIRNHDFRHTVTAAIYRAGMSRGDPDIVPKIARLLGHRKLSQTSHYLEGLLKNDEPSDAGRHLTWGEIDDEFVVAAAGWMTKKDGDTNGQMPISTCRETLPASHVPYPIPIGRPRKNRLQEFTLNSPSNDENTVVEVADGKS